MKPTLGIYCIPDRADFPAPGYTHDHSLCIMEDGQVVHYLQLERWTRRKYDNQLHLHLEELIDGPLQAQARAADWVVVNSFVESSFLTRNGRFRAETHPRDRLHVGHTPMRAWGEFAPGGGHAIPAFSIDHELAHVCSNLPFYGPFPENSLHVHFDGGASLSNCSVFLYRNGQLQLLDFHWKLSRLSKFFNDNALSFALLGHAPGDHCTVPGKLMGFATLAEPDPAITAWLQAHDFFKDCWQDKADFYARARADFGWQGQLGDTRDPFLQRIAASFQQVFTDEWLAFLAQTQAHVHADALFLSGGCALNIVANTQLLHSGLFPDLLIPPCPGDSGLSLGAAAFHEWQRHGHIARHSPYLNSLGLALPPPAHSPELVALVGDRIAAGEIIGLYQGAGEIGPRALGQRSLIARPDVPALAARVSMTCKGREWYRPIAPVMLEAQARRLTGQAHIHPLSQYMLLDFAIPPAHRAALAGVVHGNGTARIQTLFERAQQPFLWDLLTYLDQQHHIPALINTSFNAPGEPIVHTPAQALESAQRMGLDAVLINGQLTCFTPTSNSLSRSNSLSNSNSLSLSTSLSDSNSHA